jgi:hypothetical protein
MMDRFPFKDYPDAPLSHEIGLVLKNSDYFDISIVLFTWRSHNYRTMRASNFFRICIDGRGWC